MITNASTSTLMPRFFEGDLHQLRSFYYAATYRKFTRAAEELATGQPSVSNHIKQLERIVGVPLFRRLRRGVDLTPAGLVLLDLVAPVVEAVDRLPHELAERTATLAVSEVSIAAGQELLLHLLAPVIQAFREENPGIRLVVYSRVREATHAMVASGEIDFGVAGRAGLPPGLEFQEILADELLLIVPSNHPLVRWHDVPLEEIARHPVLMPDRHSSTRRAIEETFAQAGLGLHVAMELERWRVIREFVAMNQGIAMVPGFSVENDRNRFAVRRVRPPFPPLSYGITVRAGAYLSPAARSLMEAIKTRASGSPDGASGMRHLQVGARPA